MLEESEAATGLAFPFLTIAYTVTILYNIKPGVSILCKIGRRPAIQIRLIGAFKGFNSRIKWCSGRRIISATNQTPNRTGYDSKTTYSPIAYSLY